ncbi:MAG: permease [bacterium]
MFIATIIMGIFAVILIGMGYFKGQGQHVEGIKTGIDMLVSILPLLVFALIVAGMIQVIIPKEFIGRLVGAESGFKGILVGSFAGFVTPGGPFVSLPVAAGFINSGAAVGPVVAYITAWSVLSLARIPLEIGVLGWRLTIVRMASVVILPPLSGVIAQIFFSNVKL